MVNIYSENDINELVDILNNDGVISVPTDTLYGLCAKMTSKKGYEKLYFIKKRPYEKSFPIMCSNLEQIKEIAIVTNRDEKIINAFMPGPITIVLKKKSIIPDYVTNGKDTVAIRLATSEILGNIIKKIDSPLFMTSANISGEKPCSNIEEIRSCFPLLDGILEGDIVFKEASTIIDCSDKDIKILRNGKITFEEVINVIK